MSDLTVEDYAIFKNIEDVREDIKKQNIPIKVIDYGAGNPKDKRNKIQMYEGVEKITNSFDLCSIGLKDKWAHTMYSLVKKHKPKNILELGTCCGFSSIYMAKAYSDSTIHTIEGDCSVAELASENVRKLNCNNIKQYTGRFQDVLPNLLEEIKVIDLAFIDGHHDKEATIEYFSFVKPFLSKNAIVVFDDISWSEGMIEAWEIIKKDTTVREYKDLKKLGICYMK